VSCQPLPESEFHQRDVVAEQETLAREQDFVAFVDGYFLDVR
jgi:hypothetical protein